MDNPEVHVSVEQTEGHSPDLFKGIIENPLTDFIDSDRIIDEFLTEFQSRNGEQSQSATATSLADDFESTFGWPVTSHASMNALSTENEKNPHEDAALASQAIERSSAISKHQFTQQVTDNPVGEALEGREAQILLSAPIDRATMLIEFWFSDVCPMWCAFDSSMQFFSGLAKDSWTCSEPVHHMLQEMSASMLLDSLPHLKACIGSLYTRALQSIHRAINGLSDNCALEYFGSPNSILFSVIGVGTSLCWVDPRMTGIEYLQLAQNLLQSFEGQRNTLDSTGAEAYNRFREAIISWEMLVKMVDSGSSLSENITDNHCINLSRTPQDCGERNSNTRTDARRPPLHSSGGLHHPWMGATGILQHNLGVIFELCRKRCNSQHLNDFEMLCDSETASILERKLLDFDLSIGHKTPADILARTYKHAPRGHMCDTVESYRLAAVLQLYMAFPQLVVKTAFWASRPDDELSPYMSDAHLKRGTQILLLTLRLVTLLKRVPLDSGIQSAHPVLLVTAAAGLRYFDTHSAAFPLSNQESDVQLSFLNDIASLMSSYSNEEACIPGNCNTSSSSLYPSVTSLDVYTAAARRFVISALGILQQNLPRRPISVAISLVRTIWLYYDSPNKSLSQMHWMNIMSTNNLQTLFGCI